MALRHIALVKAELQSQGVRIVGLPDDLLPLVRTGGAGPAEGITLLLDGTPACVPFTAPCAASSPYSITREHDRWVLNKHGEPFLCIDIPRAPRFYTMMTQEGIPYRHVALLHGTDCLASTVLQRCQYWHTSQRCWFCGIEISLQQSRTVAVKRAEDLAAAACAAKDEGVVHVTLTSGSTRDRQEETKAYCEASKAIWSAARLPIHVQLLPPIPRASLEDLRDAGVCSIGIHRESFDPKVLEQTAPCKAAIPLDAYRDAWKNAVEVFGWGQVSSFILMGLGEDPGLTKDGIRELAELGVYPFLVPLRPLPGTPWKERLPPGPGECIDLYEYAADILKACGLTWQQVSAGCVRCRGCSALPDFEDLGRGAGHRVHSVKGITCKVVTDPRDVEKCVRIWQEVFVEEQGLRLDDTENGGEAGSVHILAELDGVPVGTVRITPTKEKGTWQGSRLAVRCGFRGKLGRVLVAKAQHEVGTRGGKRLEAYVQLQRVAFFQRCGWRCIGKVPDYCGRPHMLMEVDVGQ